MTKLSNEGNDLLEAEPINKQRLDFIAASLNEKLNLVKTFDEEIIENGAVDEIEAEIQESDEINSGAPNDNFRKNICSEDDLRSRIFGTFVVKFLACLPLLGFSNI